MTRTEILTAMGMSIEEATEKVAQEEAARQAFRAAPAPSKREVTFTDDITTIYAGGAVVRGIIDENGEEFAQVTNWSLDPRKDA